MGRPSFTLKTTLHFRPAFWIRAVPRVATSRSPSSAKRAGYRDDFGFVAIVDADEDGAFLGQRRAGAELGFGEGFAEVFAYSHNFACGAHLGSEGRVDAGEFIEREYRGFDEIQRNREASAMGGYVVEFRSQHELHGQFRQRHARRFADVRDGSRGSRIYFEHIDDTVFDGVLHVHQAHHFNARARRIV